MIEHGTTFYILRHGETEWNVARRMQGHMDSPLTQQGIQQAHDVAQVLKEVEFAAIFSSDLLRAHRTAAIVALERDIEIKTTELLRERSFGRFEGWEVEKYREALKEELYEVERLSDAERMTHKHSDDIESEEETSTRLLQFLREVAVAYADKNVLIASHGGVIRAFLLRLGWGTYQELSHNAVRNTAFVKCISDGTDFEILETHNVVKSEKSL